MGLFYRPDREGSGRPLPSSGVLRLLALAGTHFWKLVGANLLFVLFSLPVLTLPAALCALNRVCILIYRKGNCFLWMEFKQEFRQSFWRSLPPAVWFGGLTFAGYFFMSMGAANGMYPVWCLIFWSLGILFTAVGIGWGAYFFALVPLLDQKNPGMLKNAFFLCMIQPGRMLLVLAVILGMAFAAAVLMPAFVVVLLLLWFAVMQLLVCYLVNGMAEDYILHPYAQRQEE